MVNQFAKGDRHARRDLIALADRLGVNLVQQTAVGEALASNHQAILDAFIARQMDVKAPPKPSPVYAPPELLNDDAENSRIDIQSIAP